MNDWTYPLFPPRTPSKMDNSRSPVRMMWEVFSDAVAQLKLNGTRNLTVIKPSGTIEMWNRGGNGKKPTQQKQYELTPNMIAAIKKLNLPLGKLHVIDGELIHAKTKVFKDILYLFDVLVYNGVYLLGETYESRYNLLRAIVGNIEYFPEDFEPKEGNIYLAQNYDKEKWDWVYEQALRVDFCEGMVLKRMGPVSRLEPGCNEINNAAFMCRVRKPNPNYRS